MDIMVHCNYTYSLYIQFVHTVSYRTLQINNNTFNLSMVLTECPSERTQPLYVAVKLHQNCRVSVV